MIKTTYTLHYVRPYFLAVPSPCFPGASKTDLANPGYYRAQKLFCEISDRALARTLSERVATFLLPNSVAQTGTRPDEDAVSSEILLTIQTWRDRTKRAEMARTEFRERLFSRPIRSTSAPLGFGSAPAEVEWSCTRVRD